MASFFERLTSKPKSMAKVSILLTDFVNAVGNSWINSLESVISPGSISKKIPKIKKTIKLKVPSTAISLLIPLFSSFLISGKTK